MATLTNVDDLVPLLNSIAKADDPAAALEGLGHRFDPALRSRLQVRRRPTAAQRKQWAEAVAQAGAVHFSVGAAPRLVARALAPGEYEFSAGLRMALANQILAGVQANGVIPDTIFLDELLSPDTLTALSGAFVQDVPGGQIGRLQITGAPTLAPIRDGFDRVLLSVPFRLNFERVSNLLLGPIRTVVTFATGQLQLSVALVTRTVPVSIAARNLEIQIDLSDSDDARIEIDPASPVQRTSQPGPGEIDGLAVILQNALQQRLADSLRFTISASIPLPIGKLEIHETAIVTRGDALLVGIKVQGIPGTGNPDTLAPLFPNATTNFFSRVHDQVLRLIVQDAARTGALTRIAKETHPDAVIDSADIAFGPNTIKVMAKGKIVDLCPLGVDLGFTATTTVTVTLEGTRIKIERDNSRDLDNLDAVLCAITSLGLALLVAVGVIVLQGIGLASGLSALAAFGVIGVLTAILEFDGADFDLVFGDHGEGGPTIIPLDFPFPGTDLLPTASGEFIRLDESTMLMAAQIGTRPDDLNTYFYVRFLESQLPIGLGRPMKGASVRLMDRDSPVPAGDDVTLPSGTTTTHTGHHLPTGDIAITTKTHYERTSDESFGEATADYAGRIRFYIPRDRLASKAGNKVVETTRVNLDTDQTTTSTRRTPVAEPNPDFYFRVTRPNGTVVDTLSQPAGFFLNFQSRRVGTPANPLTITFGGGLVVFDPGIGFGVLDRPRRPLPPGGGGLAAGTG